MTANTHLCKPSASQTAPALIGSEKQIHWATINRKRWYDAKMSALQAKYAAEEAAIFAELCEHTNASEWMNIYVNGTFEKAAPTGDRFERQLSKPKAPARKPAPTFDFETDGR